MESFKPEEFEFDIDNANYSEVEAEEQTMDVPFYGHLCEIHQSMFEKIKDKKFRLITEDEYERLLGKLITE